MGNQMVARVGPRGRDRPVNRRRFLVAGAGVAAAGLAAGLALVEEGVLPGRTRLHESLGGCGKPGTPPDVPTGEQVSGTLPSRHRGTTVAYRILYPPGAAPGAALPVVLALHGRGGNAAWPVEALHLDAFLAGAAADEPPARFAVVTVDGGDAVNWHPRRNGDDPLAMLTDELLPALAGRGLRVDRPALLGWSLGGAGALLLAARLGAARCAALVASSPAIWTSASATGAGTYDDPEDFEHHRVDGLGPSLAGVPTWIDAGDLDPFAPAVTAFRATLDPEPAGGIEPGCHDEAFWTRQLPSQLAFLAARVTTQSG
jgi:pimeloyl-ACP methyl ester carboxylesterase